MNEQPTKPIEHPLSPAERAPIDELDAQISAITHQRLGMIVMLARLKGIADSAIDYVDGMILATPRGEQK